MSCRNVTDNEEISLGNFNLEKAKNLCIEEINSERRFEQISDFKDLIKVLLDRDDLNNKLFSSLEFGPAAEKIIENIKNSDNTVKTVELPENVLDLITEKFCKNWKELGRHLKLSEAQLNDCKDIKGILDNFQSNCVGVSEKEIYFRLNLALEKCNEKELQLQLLKLLDVPQN